MRDRIGPRYRVSRLFAQPVWACLLACAAVLAAGAHLAPAGWQPTDPPNAPIGEARGIHPGRVVWVYDPAVAHWDEKTGHWWDDANTDPAGAERMVRHAVCWLTGERTDAAAWDALFRHFNRAHGRGESGYKPGEKIAVKVNFNSGGCCNSPQITLALLRQLVNVAKAAQADITIFEPGRGMPEFFRRSVLAEFPGLRLEAEQAGNGVVNSQPDRNVAIRFGDPSIRDSGKCYLPRCLTEATYLINAAVLKGHVLAGVTLCAKNHFGSFYRDPGGNRPSENWRPDNLHRSVTIRSRPMGSYNGLVDLMGHAHLDGKALLFLVDGLYAGVHQSVNGPSKWQSAPFNGGWTSSLFVSQDEVALESVGLDFIRNEPTIRCVVGSADNYLHEAAQANDPPSKTVYDPEGDGTPLKSLGVHEHWNNAAEKRYSRNLGAGKGIELISAEPN